MKKDLDKIILESRSEISLLQNVLDIAINSGKCSDEEKEAAKELSELLETMWYSW